MAFPRGAMGLSAVCNVVFPDYTHYFREIKILAIFLSLQLCQIVKHLRYIRLQTTSNDHVPSSRQATSSTIFTKSSLHVTLQLLPTVLEQLVSSIPFVKVPVQTFSEKGQMSKLI